jgi:hypothetical protein
MIFPFLYQQQLMVKGNKSMDFERNLPTLWASRIYEDVPSSRKDITEMPIMEKRA